MAKKHKGLRQGLNTLNLMLVATFIVLALYSAIGQQIIPYIGKYRLDVERYISQQLGSQVQIRTLSGAMRVLTPSVHIEGFTVYPKKTLANSTSLPSEKNAPILSIAAVDAVLDPGSSLLNLTPVFKSVRLSGVSIILGKDALTKKQSTENQQSDSSLQRLVESLLLQQHLEINNVSIESWLNEERQTLQIDHMVMTGDGFNRLMTGSISYGNKHKIKAGMRIFSQGSPYDLGEFYARGVIDLPNLDVNYWLEQFSGAAIFNEFQASAQLGFEFKEGLLNYAKLDMATPTLSVPDQEDFKNINTQLWLKQNNVDTWSLWLEDGQFTFKDRKWQLQDLALKLSKTQQGNRWHSFIKEVNLEYIQDLMSEFDLVPDSLAPFLDGLNARGQINNFSVVLQHNKDEELGFTVAAELEDISINAHGGIPGITNLSGVLAANKYSGRVQFSSEQMQLEFPKIYDNAFNIIQGSGQVDWFVGEHQTRIIGDGLKISLSDVDAIKGGFQLWMPNDENLDNALELNLSFEGAPLSAQHKLVPSAVSAGLRAWLDSALKKGQVEEGNIYLYSSLSAKQPLAQIELYFNVDKVNLSYLSEWPEIRQAKGKLFIDNNRVFATLDTAQTLGGSVQGAQVAFQDDKNGLGYLWINSQAQGAASDMFSYFQHTLLQTIVNNQFDEWQLTGKHKTSLAFKIPLDSPIEGMAVGVQTTLSDAELQLNDVGLNFSDLSGKIQFTSKKGLTSSGLKSRLWGQDLNANIASEYKSGKLITDIAFKGELDTKGLKDWLKLGLLNGVSGKTWVDGHFIIDGTPSGFTGLKVKSDLLGIELDLPEPVNKQSIQQVSFNTSLQIKDGLTFKLSYDDKVNLAMHFKEGEFSAGQVYLGAIEAYVPSSQGMIVQGHIEKLNVNEWLDAWQKIQNLDKTYGAGNDSSANPLSKVILSSDEIVYNDFKFEHVKTEINVSGNSWKINVDSPLAKGDIVYEVNKATSVNLQYLHWPALSSDQQDSEADPLLEVDPATFPALNLSIEEVFLGPTNYGRWKLRVVPNAQGVEINDIDGHIKKLDVKGSMSWIKPGTDLSQQKTSVKLQLSSSDVGGIQKAWHQKPVLEADSLQTDLDLHWLASPALFEFESLSGALDFQLQDGRFVDAGDTGALSAFGLLNFSAIGRRLRLDFSDVYQSGLHFDDIKGKTSITNGLIEIVDTLDFVGPSANFSASGTVNSLTKELDQELAVTFPVFSTLPFVAILAGFAPPIAASIFVGEKLVGGEIEKFSSATYKLSGTWEKPELKLMKRFDNEIEGKKDKSFWLRMKDVFGLGGAD